jgi:hypothetical protein
MRQGDGGWSGAQRQAGRASSAGNVQLSQYRVAQAIFHQL